MGDVANKDEAFKCIDIARDALKAGEHARAEKFAAKALKLYRCSQTESLVLQVQVYIAERTRSPGAADTPQPARPSPSSNGTAQQHSRHQEQQHDRTSTHHHHSSRPQQHQQQQHAHHTSERSRQQHPSSSAQRQQGSSAHRQQQQQHPRGMGGSEGLRHRAAAAAPEPPVQEDPSVTPEQRKVVQQILAAKSFYDVMGVAKDATEADVKSAYKKLALRLHPDKNKALKADEAFKLLSKAFSCLSNADKRAYYDRTGFENSSAAQAAAASRRSQHSSGMSNGMGNGAFFYSGADEFDPEEIFNAFFGAGAFHPHASRVFRSQFGGYAQQQQQRQQRPASREEQQRAQMLGIFQVLPILLIVLVTFFSSHSEPVYSLVRDAKYVQQLHTGRLGVPYWVKSQAEFDKAYPIGNYKRLEVERQVESDVYERTYQRCQNERMAQHRAFTWGNRDAARKMELASCQELSKLHEALGTHRPAGVVR